jgi:hypothetical protein
MVFLLCAYTNNWNLEDLMRYNEIIQYNPQWNWIEFIEHL